MSRQTKLSDLILSAIGSTLIRMSTKGIAVGVFLLLATLASGQPMADEYQHQRQHLVAEIESEVRQMAGLFDSGPFDETVMQAMATIPRHEFVPRALRSNAYENRPLAIGYGQTISQPLIVALMTALLQPQADDVVLEIGTGSGYQAAVLSPLVKQVYSIEIVEALGKSATSLLARLGFDNIQTRIADGYEGWPENQPFDGIIVTAAISHIPPPLVRQLARGGRMVIPVGTRFQTQYLTLVEKDLQGNISSRQLLPVRFVPFTGGH